MMEISGVKIPFAQEMTGPDVYPNDTGEVNWLESTCKLCGWKHTVQCSGVCHMGDHWDPWGDAHRAIMDHLTLGHPNWREEMGGTP